MWPREHGAYGQVGFPLATALALTGLARASLLLALAVVAVFLAHEPLQVLVGGRGARARRERGTAALAWGAFWIALALVTGLTGLVMMPGSAKWTIVWPLAPAAPVLLAAARGREKATLPEVSAAVAFSFAAIPVCIAAGVSGETAATVGLAYAVTFTVMTLAVRVVVQTTRPGGRADAAATRVALLAVVGCTLVSTAVAVVAGLWPPLAPVVFVPGLAVGTTLALRPPRATKLRVVGWSLVGTSCATMALVLTALS